MILQVLPFCCFFVGDALPESNSEFRSEGLQGRVVSFGEGAHRGPLAVIGRVRAPINGRK